MADVALLFAALSDETRLSLVDRLCADGPVSIAQLTSGTDVARRAVTRRLGALRVCALS